MKGLRSSGAYHQDSGGKNSGQSGQRVDKRDTVLGSPAKDEHNRRGTIDSQTLNLEINQQLLSEENSRLGVDRVDITDSECTPKVKPGPESATNLSLTKTAKFGDKQSTVQGTLQFNSA